MRRRASVAISVATILSLLLVSMAAGTTSAADRSAADKAKAEKAQHDKTIAYWTAERIANAQPRDFVRTSNGQIVPKAKPGGGGSGTSGGASYSGGGPVVQRTGKVLFTMGGGNWVCSATVIQEPVGGVRSTHSLVLTAAHCAYDEAADEFATNWIFVPSFDTSPTFTCAQATIGCWTATGLVVHSGWANEESLYDRGDQARLRHRHRGGRRQDGHEHPARQRRRRRLSDLVPGDLDRRLACTASAIRRPVATRART